MKWLTLLIGVLGLGFAAWLIVTQGPELVFKTFTAAGWGVIFVSALHFLHMVLAGRGWQVLWPTHRRPALKLFIWVLWVREAVNALLPVARIGGEVASLNILQKSGMPVASSVGSLVVETTISVATTFVFIIMGLFVLSWRVPEQGLFLQWALGLGLSLGFLVLIIALQRAGGFQIIAKIINHFAHNTFKTLNQSGAKLDRAVMAFYARPSRVFGCTFWSFAAWWVGALELWVALKFLGHNALFSDGIILEAMIMATGSAAFFVPASIGIQEGTFLVFGRMLGISDEICIALALIRRTRDVLVMAPGLILWQMREHTPFKKQVNAT
jgi:glycosyltransferase 2 family protein